MRLKTCPACGGEREFERAIADFAPVRCGLCLGSGRVGLDVVNLEPGLYRVEARTFVAGFVVGDRGRVEDCAPILRRRLAYWAGRADWVGPRDGRPWPFVAERRKA